ncbi:hypothetical protein AVEN_175135-1 [Araneus ventricosus]|uniref:Uncharacterized protein n=1 Tax=Araneus ventricosus TaxID=182803 RepID=A0A4Y2FI16_ARAVE|nr:hypothetical protein AVEN_175135-1 [Araneus ventricosus]
MECPRKLRLARGLPPSQARLPSHSPRGQHVLLSTLGRCEGSRGGFAVFDGQSGLSFWGLGALVGLTNCRSIFWVELRSFDEPADKPESSDWGNYWDEQASKEQPAAADEQASKEPASSISEPKQPIAADEPVSKEPKQSIVWEDIIEKDVIILNLQHLKKDCRQCNCRKRTFESHYKIVNHHPFVNSFLINLY